MNKEKYLKEHFIKDNGYCKEYDNIKACVIASIDGTITYYNNPDPHSYENYYRWGCNSKEYHERYKNHSDFQVLPFF